ncbi:MAG: flagellar protein [Butyrivibrio sp.]|nr:flagellar protein [Butyrivibrio sp.]MBQ8030093.1 flagellar protein [Butyrivibrio sp.]MBR1643210.1 flagellar protein [Butyrivibrio sp.]
MNLRNCARCGKMFNYVAGPVICEPCKKLAEEDFQKVKQYIQDNPRASLKQISEDNEVTTKQIQQWIREERLMFSKDSPIQLLCEKCGEPITTGRFCAKCKTSMANTLNDTVAQKRQALQQAIQQKQEPKSGMRFLDT